MDNTPIPLPTTDSPEHVPAKKKKMHWLVIGAILLLASFGFLLVASFFISFDPGDIKELIPTATPNIPATQMAWTKPSQSPSIGSAEAAQLMINSDKPDFEKYIEFYATYIPEKTIGIPNPGDTEYLVVVLDSSQPLLWGFGWCASSPELLKEYLTLIEFTPFINEESIPQESIAVHDYQNFQNEFCRSFVIMITNWPVGLHQLHKQTTLLQPITKGGKSLPAGIYHSVYFVER